MLEKIIFPYKKYKKLWEKQNSELDIQTAEITKKSRELAKCKKIISDNEEQIVNLQGILKIQVQDNRILSEKSKNLYYQVKNFEEENEEIKEKLRKYAGRNGGLTKENNKLQNEVKTLSKQLENALSDAYLRKKIKPGRLPKMQPSKIKSSSVQSRIIKQVKEM